MGYGYVAPPLVSVRANCWPEEQQQGKWNGNKSKQIKLWHMAQGVEAARRFLRNCFALSVIISRELQRAAAAGIFRTSRQFDSRKQTAHSGWHHNSATTVYCGGLLQTTPSALDDVIFTIA
jgi:hypothetical protein